jgi:hypothetical protein
VSSNKFYFHFNYILIIYIFISEFNKKWQESIDEKAAKEVESEKAVRVKATEELSNWKSQREIRLNAKKDVNRIEEQDLLEGLESEVDGINTWDRVMKLVTANSEIESGCTDTSRMRNLFIQLKNESLEKTRLTTE